MTKWEHRQGWAAQEWVGNSELCLYWSLLSAAIGDGSRDHLSQARNHQCCWGEGLAAPTDTESRRCRVRRMGGVFLLPCYCVCFTFSWCCPLRQKVCSFSLWIDPWNLILLEGGQGHLQQIRGLAVHLCVTLGRAFLCRGRAGELLQAFVVFPIETMLE